MKVERFSYMNFGKYNCIVVFNEAKDKILFCKRMKRPYKGLYNFVGGKLEENETSKEAAYRELYEESGIGKADIKLIHLMDSIYYPQEFILEIYTGVLNKNIDLVEELNPLAWLSTDEDFADTERFAGDGNIAHIVRVALKVLNS